LSNAIRHTSPGGEIFAALAATADAVELRVSNPGPGISPEHLERVFDRFYQVNGSRERSDAGTGLGLAIVKSIMRLHGGDARVASEPGRLTTFTLQFPGSLSDLKNRSEVGQAGKTHSGGSQKG